MKNKILLIDGSSYLYRAFHTPSLSRLTTPEGELSGTTFGFNRSLNLLIQHHQPTHCCVVFDPRGKTKRNDYFPSYKANRPPTPEEIIKAFTQTKELLSIRSINHIQIEKQEADDVIGSLTRKLVSPENEIIIASGDKDLSQLVTKNILLTNIKKGEIETFDEQGIKEKTGVFPQQIADYLALMGDSVDNIPGVKGVGAKTAVKLISDYQNIQGIIDNAENIPGKIGKALQQEKTNIPLYVKLTTIDCDIPLQISLQDLSLHYSNNYEAEKEYYKKMGFISELHKLEKKEDETKEEQKGTTNHQQCSNITEWIDKIAKNQTNNELFLWQDETKIVACLSPSRGIFSIDKEVLRRQTEKDISQHFKTKIEQKIYAYDWKSLWYQANLKPIVNQSVDLMLMFYLLFAGKTSAQWKNASKEITRLQTSTATATEGHSENITDILTQLSFLLNIFNKEIKENQRLKALYEKIEKPLQYILVNTEQHGVYIEKEILQKIDKILCDQISDITNDIFQLSKEPFNIDSPKQVGEILYHKMQLPVLQKTPKGQPSTNEEALNNLSLAGHEIAQKIMTYRGLSKLQSTYTKGLIKHITKHGRVHTKLNQTVTSTGRLSSSEPNLQNIPIRTANGRLIRQAFCAPKGKILMAADYSQIELRILADQTGDEQLMEAFNQNLDIHKVTAAKVFKLSEEAVSKEQRRYAKTINFGLIYGMSAFSLSKQLSISLQEAKEWIEAYFKQFPKILNYMESVKEMARQYEWVETFMGRKIHVPDINSRNYKLRGYAERAAINAPIQGAAADIIKLAMVKVFDLTKEDKDIEIVLQVHDELLFEVNEGKVEKYRQKIQHLMQNVVTLKVPLIVDVGVGKNWDQAH